VRKQPCCTQMEVNHQAHSFTVDDQDQLQITEMHVEPKRFPALIEVQYVNVVTFTKNMQLVVRLVKFLYIIHFWIELQHYSTM
jgi:hypothetical protein